MAVTDIFGQDDPTNADALHQQELLRQLRASAAANGTPIANVGSPAAPVAAGAVPSSSSSQDPSSPSPYSYAAPKEGDLSANATENHYSQIGALKDAGSDAMTGAQIGKYFGGIGAGAGAAIGAGVGAIRGYLKGRTNDTKNEREQFAQSLGAKDSTDLWAQLNQYLPPQEAQELQNRALNRIGKHDETANTQWEQDVQTALANALVNGKGTAAGAAAGGAAPGTSDTPSGTPGTPAGTTPGTTSAAPAGTSATPGQYTGMLQGFNMDKFNDPNKHDPKYDFARIAADYPPTPDGLKQMASDPRFAAAGYKFVGDDKIQVPNGSTIDVGLSFGSGGGKGWAWQPVSGPDAAESGGGGPAAGPQGTSGSYTGALGINGLVPTDTGFYNTLQQKIADILGGNQVFDRDALIQQLTQQGQ